MKALSFKKLNRERELLFCEQGSTLFFVAAVLLPLIFFLFSLSIDVAKYYQEQRRVQKILDDTAMYAHRFLPYTEAAAAAAEAFLEQYPAYSEQVSVSAESDQIVLHHEGESRLMFARYFGINKGIPLAVYSRTQGTPFDTVIMIDTSAYLAPEVLSEAAWGDEALWPEASFFVNDFPTQYKNINGLLTPLNLRVLTQQCFNPAFSAIKLASIRTYQYLASFKLNSVGVSYFPGITEQPGVLRPVSPPPVANAPLDITFPVYGGQYMRSDYCAAAAERELQHSAYRFPELATNMSGLWQPPAGAPLSMVKQDSWRYDEVYNPFLTLHQAIWSLSAKDNLQHRQEVVALLSNMKVQLVGALSNEERKGLVNRPMKTGIIFAGDVPWHNDERFPSGDSIDTLEQEFEALRVAAQEHELRFNLVYVLFPHPGNQGNLVSRVNSLKTLFAQQSDPGMGLELRVLFTNSAEAMYEDLVSLLALNKRKAGLAR